MRFTLRSRADIHSGLSFLAASAPDAGVRRETLNNATNRSAITHNRIDNLERMKQSLISRSLAALALTGLLGAAQAATNYVTVVDDGTVANLGVPGSFYHALTNCNSGDTIAFNIQNQGSGPFYFQVPYDGFPLIYHKYNLTIDGYTQSGASPNTNPLTNANNAVIKIVIDGRAGGGRSMEYAQYGTTIISDPPIDNSASASEGDPWSANETALLGIYRSTNITIRGLAFLGTTNGIKTGSIGGDQKGICIAGDYGGDTAVYPTEFGYTNGISAWIHINGCWLGVDPGNPTPSGVCYQRINITSYAHGSSLGRPQPWLAYLTVGVAKDSTNPRAEFNVVLGGGCGADIYGIRNRFCGNFWGVLPDGVTGYNPIATTNYWRNDGWVCPEGGANDTQCNYIGTDGDGVNDADEGNLFGPIGISPYDGYATASQMEIYMSSDGMPWVIAGNRFGIANDGTRWTNNNFVALTARMNRSGRQIRFGSDFNGVSDALEANILYNNSTFADIYPVPFGSPVPSLFDIYRRTTVQTDCWMSCRGNVMVNNYEIYNPNDNYWNTASQYPAIWAGVVTDSTGSQATVPAINNTSTINTITGTFCPPNPSSYYTNEAIVDLYVADPEGTANGAQFGLLFFGGTGGGAAGWGFPQGKQYLGSYRVPNPASGAFSFDISSLGLAHGTTVTLTVTYSSFKAPNITSVSHSGTSTTVTWTGDAGGPFVVAGQGGNTSGFGLQRATSPSGPWTTSYAAGNSVTITDAASAAFYRIVGPVNGMTTIFAPAFTLP
jgi:hypothetical protein